MSAHLGDMSRMRKLGRYRMMLNRDLLMHRAVVLFLVMGLGLSLAGCVVNRDDPWCARHPHRCAELR